MGLTTFDRAGTIKSLKPPTLDSQEDTVGFLVYYINMKKERVAIYIDGSNLYFKLSSKELGFYNLGKFDYRGLCSWLSRDREVISYRYYIGVVKAEDTNIKGQELRKNQQRLFAHLESAAQGFKIKRGYLMKNDGTYHEKGVDVKIAVDLLAGAYEDIYDTAILISSDTDLIPVIQKVKYQGKKVEYIGFSHQPSFGLQKYATLSRLLIKEDLAPFVEKTYIDKLAFIELKDRKILETCSFGKDKWYIPGGKREAGESDQQALIREVKEELLVDLVPESIKLYGVFEAQAHGKPEGTFVRMTCYTSDYKGTLNPSAEVEKLDWFDYSKRDIVSAVDQLIFDDLKSKNLID